MKSLTALLAIVLPLTNVFAAESTAGNPHPALIPAPATIEWREGVLRKDGPLSMERVADLPAEGYAIEVAPTGAVIRSASDAGAFYARQTLQQLRAADGSLPCVAIRDAPRFAWRGFMLDSSRHFQTTDDIKRWLELLAMHKLSVFHWHLVDDHGWRFESKQYPLLTQVGAWREQPPVGRYGGFYTQQEMRDVVAYAAKLHITVVPEIEMPGHAQAAIAAYPELGNVSQPVEVSKGWGIHEDVYNVEETTLRVLQNVLDEVLEMFPSQFIHIGGDECPKKQWRESPAAQARMHALGLKDEEELQSFFVGRMDAFLSARGRRLIGWDEILEGGLAPGAAVMSWRGEEGGIEAANAGHDVVMAPTAWTYFDYPNTPVEKVYSFEPIPKELSPEQAVHVLGAQAQMWTDNHPSEERIDALVYPRAAALAEVVWSPAASRNYDGFVVRLKDHLPRLAALGVHYKPLAATGTVVGHWTTEQTSPTPKIVDWPLATGIKGAGKYDITFQYEGGKSRYQIHAVEIVQDGKVLATDKHFGWSGGSDKDNVYHVELPAMSGAPLILRATVSTDFGPDSKGRIMVGKTP